MPKRPGLWLILFVAAALLMPADAFAAAPQPPATKLSSAKQNEADRRWIEIREELEALAPGPGGRPETAMAATMHLELAKAYCGEFLGAYPGAAQSAYARFLLGRAFVYADELAAGAKELARARREATFARMPLDVRLAALQLEIWASGLLAETAQIKSVLSALHAAVKGREQDRRIQRFRAGVVKFLLENWLVDEARAELVAMEKTKSTAPEALAEREQLSQAIKAADALKIGAPVMALAGKRLNGKRIDIARLRGKVVVIDFWATWCPPCVAALPHLKELYASYRKKGLVIIGVCEDDERAVLADFVKKNNLTWPMMWEGDADGAPAERFQISAFPTVLIVDRKGIVRYRGHGGAAVDYWLKKLLGK